MQFFVDTASIEDIEAVNKLGIIDGVTTNPTLIRKSGRNHEATIRQISKIVDGPISVETLGLKTEEMIREAEEYVTWGDNIVIKVVMTPDGINAVRILSDRGIKTNVTLIFSSMQAVIAAKAGATYVSPFIGRLDDVGHDGVQIIEQIRQMYDNYQFTTNILAASIRNPLHVAQVAEVGADVATLPPKVLTQLFDHPLTKLGIDQFIHDSKAWTTAKSPI